MSTIRSGHERQTPAHGLHRGFRADLEPTQRGNYGLVLIVDDFAMREHTPTQSDDLYDLVSDRAIAAKPLILTSNRAPKDWYPLFPNPVVAESLLDRLINTSHQVLMDGPSYRPRKRPGATAPLDNT